MLRPIPLTSLLLPAAFAFAACAGRISSGGTTADNGGDAGTTGDAWQPNGDAWQPNGDDASPVIPPGDDATVDVATDAVVSSDTLGLPPDDAPNPPVDVYVPGPDAYVPPASNGCGGVCSGVTSTVESGWQITGVTGRWAFCAGQLIILSPYTGGFPADTAGIEFDWTTNTAYMLVVGDAGSLVRGLGPQYVWHVALNSPVMGPDPNVPLLNFSNSYNFSLVQYGVTLFPAGDVCPADMHFIAWTSGDPQYQSDFLLVP